MRRNCESLEQRRLLTATLEVLADPVANPSTGYSSANGFVFIDRGYGTTVHARASQSTVSTYDPRLYRYEWNFGDTNSGVGNNNEVSGFNGAHQYYTSTNASRTITLTIRSGPGSTGIAATDTIQVSLQTGSYANTIYVDGTSGNDTSNGSSTATAVRSLNRAMQLVTSPSTRVLLKRGTTINATFPLPEITVDNVMIGSVSSYGTGLRPTVSVPALASTISNTIFRSSSSADNFFIKTIAVVGPSYTDKRAGFVVRPSSKGVTILEVDHDNVAEFVHVDDTARGVFISASNYFASDPAGFAVGDYSLYATSGGNSSTSFTYASGITAIGNTFGRSHDNHNVRTNADYVNIFACDLTQYGRAGNASNINSLRANSGKYISWSQNTVRGGMIVAGKLAAGAGDPNGTPPAPQIISVEGNTVLAQPFHDDLTTASSNPRIHFDDQAERIVIRNNIVEHPNMRALQLENGVRDIAVLYNTFINENINGTYNGSGGRAVSVLDTWVPIGPVAARGIAGVELRGNLFHAPAFVPRNQFDTALIVHDFSPANGSTLFNVFTTVNFNVWADRGSANPNVAGGLFMGLSRAATTTRTWDTLSSWNSRSFVGTDYAVNVSLDASRRPLSGARLGSPVSGVAVDIGGLLRPTTTGGLNVGARE